MGVTVDQMIAYIDSFPAWANVCWGMGTIGAVIGSLLLLLRTRYAVWAFGVSLLGLAGTALYQFTTPQPEWTSGGMNTVMTVVIWLIALALFFYAYRMRNRGVLLHSVGRYYHGIKIRPPMCFDRAQADLLVETMDAALKALPV